LSGWDRHVLAPSPLGDWHLKEEIGSDDSYRLGDAGNLYTTCYTRFHPDVAAGAVSARRCLSAFRWIAF
jgi:hypothetical protein